MDMNTMGRWKRGLFSTTHRYNNLQYTPTTVTPKGYGVYITETNLSFKVFSDQTPHSNSKSPNLQGGGSAVVVVHRITHCGDAKVGSQPGMLKQIRQRTRTREPWGASCLWVTAGLHQWKAPAQRKILSQRPRAVCTGRSICSAFAWALQNSTSHLPGRACLSGLKDVKQ